MDVPDSILELAAQAGPWGWVVVGAAGVLWLPHVALVAAAASGRRVPVAAFVGILGLLGVIGCAAGLWQAWELGAAVQQAGLDSRIAATATGLRTALLPLVLVGRLAPAMATVAALAMAVGVWMRAPDTRFWAGRQAVGPAILAGVGACVALVVDPRVALAAVGVALALGLVSAADDDDAQERRFIAHRRVAVSMLALTAMGLAVLAPAAAAVARGDGGLGLQAWPLAGDVAYYSPSTVLQRYGVLPAALAPMGLAGLAALWAVLPLSTRLGGRRAWAGFSVALGLVLAVGGPALALSWAHQQGWERVLPPRTQVAVPRVDRVVDGRIQRRMTWTPGGVLDNGSSHGASANPTAKVAVPPGVDPVAFRLVRGEVRHRARDVTLQRRVPWDVEIPSVTGVADVMPLFRALATDPDIAGGIDLVVVGSDGFAGTVPVGLTDDPDTPGRAARIPLSPERSWAEVVEQVDRVQRRGEAVMLVIPSADPVSP